MFPARRFAYLFSIVDWFTFAKCYSVTLAGMIELAFVCCKSLVTAKRV